jgi:hypothetical protein
MATTDMVASPFEVALFAVSLGTAASATSSRKAAMAATRAAGREIAKEAADKALEIAAKRALRAQMEKRAMDLAEKAVARDALKRLADDAFDALDDEALDLLVKWSDDIGEAPAQAAPAARADLLSSMDEQFDALDGSVVGGIDEALSSSSRRSTASSDGEAGPLLRPVRREADAARQASEKLAGRVQNAIRRKIDEMDAARHRFANWADANQARLVETIKANVFDPVMTKAKVVYSKGVAVKNYVPNKLRSRSELFDQFMIRKGELSRYKAIGLGRVARSCLKLGIRIGEEFE